MKKILCIILSFVAIISICGCQSADTNSKSEDNNTTTFKQEVTIVTMPSPPKCKTTDDILVIEEVIEVLGQIEKSPIPNEKINGGWNIMIKLKIDGQSFNYTIGSVFTDSDGKQYNVTNSDEIKDKIREIYDNIDAPEVDYP